MFSSVSLYPGFSILKLSPSLGSARAPVRSPRGRTATRPPVGSSGGHLPTAGCPTRGTPGCGRGVTEMGRTGRVRPASSHDPGSSVIILPEPFSIVGRCSRPGPPFLLYWRKGWVELRCNSARQLFGRLLWSDICSNYPIILVALRVWLRGSEKILVINAKLTERKCILLYNTTAISLVCSTDLREDRTVMWCLGLEGGECLLVSTCPLLSPVKVSSVTRRQRVRVLIGHLCWRVSWIPSGPRIILHPEGPFFLLILSNYVKRHYFSAMK